MQRCIYIGTPYVTPEVANSSKPRRRLLLKWSLTISGILFAVLIWKCGSGLLEAKKLTEPVVARFHSKLNAGEYEQIYSEADEGFRQSGSKEDVIKLFSAIHRKLGDAGATTFGSMNVNATLTGTFITTQYNTAFTGGTATETFVWLRDGGSVKLHGYNINSSALITN